MKTKFRLPKKSRYFLYTLLAVVIFQSCEPYVNENKKYNCEVRLSNDIGSDYHYCDSISYINNEHIILYKGGSEYMNIIIPKNVTIRVTNNR